MCYDWISRDFFKYLSEQNPEQEYWIVPGSLNKVYKKDDFIEKHKNYNLTCPEGHKCSSLMDSITSFCLEPSKKTYRRKK